MDDTQDLNATETEDTGSTFDMDAAVDEVGAGLGFARAENVPGDTDEGDTELPASGAEADAQAAAAAPAATTAPTVGAPPQSWAKEHHATWAALPPAAQQYIGLREKQMLDGLEQYKGHATIGRQMQEALTPFMPMIQARGMEPAKAVQALLNAQALLERDPVAGLRRLAESYRVDLTKIVPGDTLNVDPAVQSLQERLAQFESKLTEQEQAQRAERHAKVASEVEAFAADPAHAYFDEVADDIAALMKGNPGMSLQDAYDKAVWANSVTRQKELTAAQAAAEKKALENARLNALKARKAQGAVVRSRDTRRTPTEPLGTMNDTMDDVLKSIRSRTH